MNTLFNSVTAWPPEHPKVTGKPSMLEDDTIQGACGTVQAGSLIPATTRWPFVPYGYRGPGDLHGTQLDGCNNCCGLENRLQVGAVVFFGYHKYMPDPGYYVENFVTIFMIYDVTGAAFLMIGADRPGRPPASNSSTLLRKLKLSISIPQLAGTGVQVLAHDLEQEPERAIFSWDTAAAQGSFYMQWWPCCVDVRMPPTCPPARPLVRAPSLVRARPLVRALLLLHEACGLTFRRDPCSAPPQGFLLGPLNLPSTGEYSIALNFEQLTGLDGVAIVTPELPGSDLHM